MFAFIDFNIYKKAKKFHIQCLKLFETKRFDFYIIDQLSRASFSVALNIAEGSGRLTDKDRRHFISMSRSSLLETVAIIDILLERQLISKEQAFDLLEAADELSRVLYSMIQKLDKKIALKS